MAHHPDNLLEPLATSMHRSQGSEYPAMVIPLAMQHYALVQRSLVYTGVTRDKQLVVMIGQKKALVMAIKNRIVNRRLTDLKQLLGES